MKVLYNIYVSANNYILIEKQYDGYLVQEMDMENEKPYMVITSGKPLEEAIRIAARYAHENEVEYGIQFGEI